MNQIIDILGLKTEDAVNLLRDQGFSIIVKESYGKNTVKTNNSRVIRQRLVAKNEIELIISFF